MGTTREQFQGVLDRFAEYWTTNQPLKTIDDFHEEMFWGCMPDQNSYTNTKDLAAVFEAFSPTMGKGAPITFHEIYYDEATEKGLTLYSAQFEPGVISSLYVHGAISWHMRDGKIAEYREQYNHSDLPWEEWRLCKDKTEAE